MKPFNLLFTVIASSLFSSAFSQNTWIQKADLAGTERNYSVGFSLNGKGYFGTGNGTTGGLQADLWEYDPVTDVWTQKANLPSDPRESAIGFAIEDKGYIGTGLINVSTGQATNDLWQYNPIANSWSQKANFPGTKRSAMFAFTVGNVAYVGGGITSSYIVEKDFWKYDPANDQWTQKANYGGGIRVYAAAFAINNNGYVGTGRDIGATDHNDFWKYDTTLNSWTQITDLPAHTRGSSVAFTLNQLGYLALGHTVIGGLQFFYDLWQYNPATDEWVQKANYPGLGPQGAAVFTVGNKAYVGTGSDKPDVHKDFWEYTPDLATNIQNIAPNFQYSIFPNPFSVSTTISFSNNENCNASITIFDLNGIKVKTLFEAKLEAGQHTILFKRNGLNSGIYLLQVVLGEQTSVTKIVIE